ncbi:hypothetical protein EV384_5051 [Micromonospora kangleipakensis]|uniref:Uncharacterized protein n=1 Tax=Micromonospora kangleipakensis TaxID=1077942 RepID=A0A4Q8BF89_9ACTN|nr:hypothetical protein EV384_5051 [Micromonospora kangleipakensis]
MCRAAGAGPDSAPELGSGGGLVGAGAVLMLLTLAWRRRERFGLSGR